MDIINIIKNDHRTVETLYKVLSDALLLVTNLTLFQNYQATTVPEDRQQIVYTIIKELSVHSACEEEVFYPVLRKAVANGEELFQRSIKEHQELKETLYKLDQMKVLDSGFDSTLAEAMRETFQHVGEEESEVLPLFQSAVSQDQLIKLGQDFLKTKNTAPTRPHPSAPATYPLNVPGNKMAAAMDKMRDAARFETSTTENLETRK